MGTSQSILIRAGLFFLFIILTGFWVRSDGKSYSTIILTIHKLISLAVVVVFGIAIYRLNQAVGFSSAELTAVVVSGVLFLVNVLSG